MEDPGEIHHTFGGVTYLGDLPTSTPKSAETMVESLSSALDVLAIPDIRSVQWSKAVLAVAAMGVVGLTRQRYHRVFLEPGSREVFLELVREAALVAVADGAEVVDLPGPLGVASRRKHDGDLNWLAEDICRDRPVRNVPQVARF